MKKRLTTEQFIEKAKIVHGDKYNYSKVEYVGNKVKVCIICPKHGEFWQKPNDHLSGKGCRFCYFEKLSEIKRKDKEEFIEQACKIHGDKYDYSKVEYKNNHTEVCIICPIHGEFWQKPNVHLRGCECPSCNGTFKLSTIEFIKNARKVHGDKYDYSKVEYKNNHTEVCIICPIHGEFWQTPTHHLNGSGCKYCSHQSFKHTKETFIEKSREIHGDKYDYSKVAYKNNSTKVCIICPIHGEFWQTPNMHLRDNGCPLCKESKLEKEIREYLTSLEIKYEREHHFKWLGLQRIDFYLPKYNVAIECQGEQHYRPLSFSRDKSKETETRNFNVIKERDQRKKKLCEKNGVKLLYFTHYKDVEEDNIITFKDKEKLLKYINEENTFTR